MPNWDRAMGQLRSTRVFEKPDAHWLFYAQELEESAPRTHLRLVEDSTKHSNHVAEITPEAAKQRSGFSVFYRSLWLLLGVVGLAWGVVVGMTLAGAGIVGPATLAAGTVIVVGLMVTLVVAGRRTQIDG
ncbi:hypothetical protein [Leucobacter luti]|uniref:hypothetical protein n=1 Tax=Leucobacter luti TaxID=340320 RepID=UPI00102D120D|nr:hypothetical protein [Leucobacter luti]